MTDSFNNLYNEVYALTNKLGLTVPFLHRPYDSNRKGIDSKIWCASTENRRDRKIIYIGTGTTQEDALRSLKKRLGCK